ncbi:hypothetical protein B5S29_g321 [[Candida] boidinii]|nr:hypothetical protein B5S29_g321 [[Candida] boidinii]
MTVQGTSSMTQLVSVGLISLFTGICIGSLIVLPYSNLSQESNHKSFPFSGSKGNSSSNRGSVSPTSTDYLTDNEKSTDSESPNENLAAELKQKLVKQHEQQQQQQQQQSSTTSDEEEEFEDEDFDEEIEIDSNELNDIPGECRMALIVRTDLGMQKGKVAAQCCHAAVTLYRLMSRSDSLAYNLPMLKRWEYGGQAKITLKCDNQDDMDLLFAKALSLNVNAYIVHDAGRTQIAAGSATVLGLGPAPKLILDQITGDLKLY